MEKEIEEILKKLDGSDYEQVKAFIESHEGALLYLQRALVAIGQLFEMVTAELKSIPTNLDVIKRELAKAGAFR